MLSVEWMAVHGFDGYEVSDDGKVRSWMVKGRRAERRAEPLELKLHRNRSGYFCVMLSSSSGRQFHRPVHRLVLSAFAGPCPPGCEASHLNRIRTDNRASNLIWEPHKANEFRKVGHGTVASGERHGRAKLTGPEVVGIVCALLGGGTQTATARRFGVSRRAIQFIDAGRKWRHDTGPMLRGIRALLPSAGPRVSDLRAGADGCPDCLGRGWFTAGTEIIACACRGAA